MFCSTIIPTIGRESLNRAVESVIHQDFDTHEFEVIVVNDSGLPLKTAAWQASNQITIINTNKRERSVARNTGAAVAQGTYLHFLDDDDWMLPDALNSFWTLSQTHPDVAWLYGGTELYDRDTKPLIKLIHNLPHNCFTQVMAGEWIPLQASLIKHDGFHKVGGFNPLIPGIEDMDLARRMALFYDFQGTEELVAGVGMGVERSTTNQEKARVDGRQKRELILNESGVFRRLLQSGQTSYLRGKIVRIYLTSATWNIVHSRMFTAVNRILYGLIMTAISFFPFAFQSDFWKAVLFPHESDTFVRGFSERQSSIGEVEQSKN